MSEYDRNIPPCDYGCDYFKKCKAESLVCTAFRDYINQEEPGSIAKVRWNWPRKPTMPYSVLNRGD